MKKRFNLPTKLLAAAISIAAWPAISNADVFTDAYDLTTGDPVPGLVFDGKDFLKLSRCCKTPKQAISITLAFPAENEWQITHINGDELVNDVSAADPIEGTYFKKNKKWYILSFNPGEEDQFRALLEDVASEEAGEEVLLAFKKFKLRLKDETDSDGVEFKLVGDFKLRRTGGEKGSGVYKVTAEYENETAHLESCIVEDEHEDDDDD